MRIASAKALYNMADRHPGELPASAVDTLIDATRDLEPQVSANAMSTLARTRDPRAMKFLSDALAASTTAPAVIANALAVGGPGAREAESRLAAIVAADDQPMAVRTSAAAALGESGADSDAAIVALAAALLMPPEHLIEAMPSDGRGTLRDV